jgi:AraC-like DNA-binding protein
MGIFRKLQHNLKQLLIDSRCHFKQEKLLSENNIVSKIATKVNSNYSPTTILPRILFKKMDPTYT